MYKGRFLCLLVVGTGLIAGSGCSVPIDYRNAPEPGPSLSVPSEIDEDLVGDDYPVPKLGR